MNEIPYLDGLGEALGLEKALRTAASEERAQGNTAGPFRIAHDAALERIRALAVKIAAIMAAATLALACNNFDAVPPGDTCGVAPVHCQSLVDGKLQANGFCCPQGTECGDRTLTPNCFDGDCCEVGIGKYETRHVPQTREK